MLRFALSFALSAILMSCNETKNNSDLLGIWQLNCFASSYCYRGWPIYNMEFFDDGTGIAYVYEHDTIGASYPYKWRADYNHLQMIIEQEPGNLDTNDYELIYFKDRNYSKIEDALGMDSGKAKELLDGVEIPSKDMLLRTMPGSSKYKKDFKKLPSKSGTPRAVLKTYNRMRGEANPQINATSIFTDARDGKTYKTVKIEEQTWMAENLRFEAEGSKCYGEGGMVMRRADFAYDITDTITLSNDEAQANCRKYGRLYDWETAMKSCPEGWHLPSGAEWEKLKLHASQTIDDSTKSNALSGKYLKAISGWRFHTEEVEVTPKPGNGMDRFSFSALPAGYAEIDSNYSYRQLGENGIWWTASEGAAGLSHFRNTFLLQEKANKLLLSARCVRD